MISACASLPPEKITLLSASVEKIVSPVPFGVTVKLPFVAVARVSEPPVGVNCAPPRKLKTPVLSMMRFMFAPVESSNMICPATPVPVAAAARNIRSPPLLLPPAAPVPATIRSTSPAFAVGAAMERVRTPPPAADPVKVYAVVALLPITMLVAVVVPIFSAPAAVTSSDAPAPNFTGPPVNVVPAAAVVITRPFVESVDVMVSAVNVSDAYAGVTPTNKKSIAEVASTIPFFASMVLSIFIKILIII